MAAIDDFIVDSQGQARRRNQIIPRPLGAAGPQVNQSTFAGPPRPPGYVAPPLGAAAPVTRAGMMARSIGALASPAAAALTAASLVPDAAELGRDRGAGRAIDDPNAGNVAAGDLRPGQLGAIRSDALTQARGDALRSAYTDPNIAAQDIGSFGAGVQRSANATALANTPAVPTTLPQPQVRAGALRPGAANAAPFEANFPVANPTAGPAVEPEQVQPSGLRADGSNSNIAALPGAAIRRDGLGGADTALSEARQAAAARGDFASLGLNGGQQLNSSPGSFGGGTSRIDDANAKSRPEWDRYALDQAIKDRDGGATQAYSELVEKGMQASSAENIAGMRERGEMARAGIGATPDSALAVETQRNRGALEVERERGKSARDIAALGARPPSQPKFTVVPGGQEVREVNGMQQLVTLPPRVLDSSGKVIDMGTASQAPQPPKAGDVLTRADGKTKVRFTGGDPKDQKNYVPV